MSATEPYDASSQASSMPNMRLSYTEDGKAVYVYVPVVPPTSSSPSPTPAHQPGSGGDGSAPAGFQPGISTGGEVKHGSGGGGGDGSVPPGFQPGINSGTGSELIKRKRGRPRKYGPGSIPPAAMTFPPPPPGAASSSGFSSPTSAAAAALPSGKRKGKREGSGNKRQIADSGTVGVRFTPHIIRVEEGEDVIAKVILFLQKTTRGVCILSAYGVVSHATLGQAASPGETVTYEGQFEIMSLSGSFLLSESGGQHSRSGGLSVSLAGRDGRVIGGAMAGVLTAASVVQVAVGSFDVPGQKRPKLGQAEVSTAPGNIVSGTSAGGCPSDSSGRPGSPLNDSNGDNPQGMANSLGDIWNDSALEADIDLL